MTDRFNSRRFNPTSARRSVALLEDVYSDNHLKIYLMQFISSPSLELATNTGAQETLWFNL